MTIRWWGFLALASQCALLGCQKADTSREQDALKEQATVLSQQANERTSLIYAEQELRLVEARAVQAPSPNQPTLERQQQQAQQHLAMVRMNLKLSQDRLRTLADMLELQAYVKAHARQ